MPFAGENMLSDFPKIQCPFIRQIFTVTPNEKYKRNATTLKLRKPEVYLAVNRVNPGYEWVFEHPDTTAVEKLDGSNVKIRTENGRMVEVQNRLNVIDPLLILKGKTFLIEGIFEAVGKGYIADNTEQAGELIGPKLQGNPYELDRHIWYPFLKAQKDLAYRSFLEHARTYDNLSNWFQNHLQSRFYLKRFKPGDENKKNVFAEGVIFYNETRKQQGLTHMAKLRRDMFPWLYEGVDIEGFDVNGAAEIADQDQFD
jgi:hypothetical protein